MDLGLQERVVVITGGASGIGAAITRLCLEEGAHVVTLTRVSVGVPEFCAEQRSAGRRFEMIEVDITDIAASQQAIARVVNQYGRIDALVHNAGVNDGIGLESGTPEQFLQSLQLNLVPAFVLTQAALPALKESRGAIVNIGSKVAVTGQGSTSGYAAAKGGLLGLTREWANELLPFGIRVNAVMPAEVMTPAYETWLKSLTDPAETRQRIEQQIPLGHRMTTPEEIAAAVLLLISPKFSSHTTGQWVHVDGGYVHLDRAVTGAPIRKSH